MVSHILVLTAFLAAPPAEVLREPATVAIPEKSASKRTPAQLKTAVHDALRREATSTGAANEAALRRLVALADEVKNDERLGEAQRRELGGILRNRLARRGRQLQTQVQRAIAARESKDEAQAELLEHLQNPPANGGDNFILGQKPGGVARAAAAAAPAPVAGQSPTNNAQELIDLIQTTIAPSSWDINGGPGVIRYFENNQSLVVRQTDEVHGQLGGLIEDLRAK